MTDDLSSPDAIRKRWALMMLQQGSDASPVRHPLQALARAAQGAMGGYIASQSLDEDRANKELLANLPGLSGAGGASASPTPQPSAPASSSEPQWGTQPYFQRQAQVLSQIRAQAGNSGIDPNYATRTASLESGMNPTAQSPSSSAGGLYQFTDKTWNQYGNGADKTDAGANTDAAMRLAKDNAAQFQQKFGRAPSNGELYLMHQQGAGGASALLSNPQANVIEALAPAYGGDLQKAHAAVVNNGGRPDMTAGDFAKGWTSRFDGQQPQQAGQPAPRQPVQIDPAMRVWLQNGMRSNNAAIQQHALALYQQYAKPVERFDPVADPNGNVYAQRGSLSGELKAAPHPERPSHGVVGTDEYGNKVYGWQNPITQGVSPTPRFSYDQLAGTAQGDSVVPPPPPGTDPKTWRELSTKNLASNILPGTSEEAASMRKEIRSLPSYQNYSQAAPIYKNMIKTAGENSKASDLNLVYSLGKIFDPNSVVREGELILAKNTAALPDWVVGTINALNGGAQLQPETRERIMVEAHHRITSYSDLLNGDLGQYRGIAERNRVRPEDVIPPTMEIAPPPKLTTPPPAATPAEIQAEIQRRGLK